VFVGFRAPSVPTSSCYCLCSTFEISVQISKARKAKEEEASHKEATKALPGRLGNLTFQFQILTGRQTEEQQKKVFLTLDYFSILSVPTSSSSTFSVFFFSL